MPRKQSVYLAFVKGVLRLSKLSQTVFLGPLATGSMRGAHDNINFCAPLHIYGQSCCNNTHLHFILHVFLSLSKFFFDVLQFIKTYRKYKTHNKQNLQVQLKNMNLQFFSNAIQRNAIMSHTKVWYELCKNKCMDPLHIICIFSSLSVTSTRGPKSPSLDVFFQAGLAQLFHVYF